MTDLAERYRSYIDCLNNRRFDRLEEFVHDGLVHNAQTLGVSGFRALLEGNVDAIPDLYFDVQLLVVDEPHVASIIRFACTPRATFLGLPPTGGPVTFTEHVFYRFREGRIDRVWSLLDIASLREQLGG